MNLDGLRHRIAIFASGAGTNARQIIDYFSNHPSIRVVLVVCNRPQAGVLQLAAQRSVETLLIDRASFYHTEALLDELRHRRVTFLVLAGFLWLIPPYLVDAFRGRILNIHPALLPRYGGKGMYGMRVHEAVHAAGERESGITIHEVNERYDEGSIVLQKSVAIDPGDNPEAIRRKVQALEHQYFAPTIEKILLANDFL